MAQVTELRPETATYSKVEKPAVQPPVPPRSGKRMKTWKKALLFGVGGALLIGLVVFGIVWSKRGVVSVQSGKVMKQDIASVVTASGEIKPPPEKFANVNANSWGKITDIYVKEGDLVKKGQVLLKTESVQQNADVAAQEAALKTAQANAEAADAAVQSSAAALKTSQADLQTAQARLGQSKEDYGRGQQLLKDKLIAQQVFDQRRSDYEVAQANVDAAQARVTQNRALHQQAVYNRDMIHAQVAQNQAMLIRVNDVRSKTIYTAPFDAIVTSLPAHMGENVVPGIQNQVGSLLFQVSDLSTITAQVKVDETDIINVKLGQPADVTIDAIPNKTFKAKVTQIGQSAVSRSTGQTTSNTSTANTEEAKDFQVSVTLDNPPPNLRPGLSATAKVTTATRQNAVTVPIQALTVRMKQELEEEKKQNQKGKVQAAAPKPETSKEKDKAKEEIQGLFVIRDGRAVFTPVETGIMGATDVEITKGVKPGDEIVTGSFSVLRTLKNNTKVKVDNSALKPGGPA